MENDDAWSPPFHEVETQTAVPYGDLHALSPFVATPQKAIDIILENLDLDSKDFLVDLGCGHGTINITAAKKYSVPGLGVDIESELISIAEEQAIQDGVQHLLQFKTQDVLETDLSCATAVVSFLVPRHLKQVADKLKTFLNSGGKLACYHYPLQGVEPTKVIKLKEEFNKSIFIYNNKK